jgi:hypothetical protein
MGITPEDARVIMDEALQRGLAEVQAKHGDQWTYIGPNGDGPGWRASRVDGDAEHHVIARTLTGLDRALAGTE